MVIRMWKKKMECDKELNSWGGCRDVKMERWRNTLCAAYSQEELTLLYLYTLLMMELFPRNIILPGKGTSPLLSCWGRRQNLFWDAREQLVRYCFPPRQRALGCRCDQCLIAHPSHRKTECILGKGAQWVNTTTLYQQRLADALIPSNIPRAAWGADGG